MSWKLVTRGEFGMLTLPSVDNLGVCYTKSVFHYSEDSPVRPFTLRVGRTVGLAPPFSLITSLPLTETWSMGMRPKARSHSPVFWGSGWGRERSQTLYLKKQGLATRDYLPSAG